MLRTVAKYALMSLSTATLCSSRHCAGSKPERFHELARHARALLRLDELQRRAALDDRAVEQPFGGRHREQRRDLAAAAGLAEHGHVAGVAAELRDVRPHPGKRVHDVEHAHGARLRERLAAELGQRREAEHVQAMIDRHDDHVAAAREIRAVGHG